MPKLSAGLLLFRERSGCVEVLIGHPGGPFWAKKDAGAWSVIKGEYVASEDPWEVARREFQEEVGKPAPIGDRYDFDSVKQPSGKILTVFAVRGDLDVTGSRSNTFEMEWPRGSGMMQEFPEIDQVVWFPVAVARVKLLKGHVPFLDRLMEQPGIAGLAEEGGESNEPIQAELF